MVAAHASTKYQSKITTGRGACYENLKPLILEMVLVSEPLLCTNPLGKIVLLTKPCMTWDQERFPFQKLV